MYYAISITGVMTVTSIGYGDLSMQRNAEYIVCFFCMLIGGILWGFTIGNISAALGNGDRDDEEYRQNFDGLNQMMGSHNLPQELQMRVRLYLRECRGQRLPSVKNEGCRFLAVFFASLKSFK